MSHPIRILCVLLSWPLATFAASDGPLAARLAHQPLRASDIRVNVNLTLVPVSVMDTSGRSVTGLNRDNFRVFDESLPVPIVSFGSQDQPVTVGLIFDCSASMRDKFRIAREAPQQLFQQLNPEDESFLVTVSDKVSLRKSLTSNFEELQSALLFVRPDGATSLVDGIFLALQNMRKAHNPRKALVIVSDGGDNNSRMTMRELEKLAMESDTQIFAANLYQNPQTREEADGPELLTTLCGRTGGTNFMISDLPALRSTMGKIGVSLHSQYVIGYNPPESGASGKYRRIRVELLLPKGSPTLRVHARSGYYLPE